MSSPPRWGSSTTPSASGGLRGRVPGSSRSTGRAGYGAVLGALTLVIAAESAAVHLLVGLWSATAAWILTGLSVWALVWLVGDFRAFGARPIRIGPARMGLRFGLRWEAVVPLADVAGVERVRGAGPGTTPGEGVLVAAVLGRPNVLLRLSRPVEVTGLYGIRRTVRELRLRVDDPDGLVDALGGSRSGE